jgi:hypothetical protein
MVVETIAEGLSVVARFVVRLLSEVLIEFLCKGMGYRIWKAFKPAINPDGALVFFTGLAFWLVLFILGYQVYEFVGIDSCLDTGGHFNYSSSLCER